MTKQFNNLEKFLLAVVFLAGGSLLFFPVQYMFFALIILIIIGFLLFNVRVCFYLVIFTLPFTERISVLPITFSVNDILIFICITSVLLNILIKNNKVSVKTSIDKWNIVLTTLYIVSGVTSISNTGILATFKFLEAMIMFYITVYLIRSKQVSISGIIKTFLFTGLYQAITGILQSTTGQFGAAFQSQRGYLGYLGIGSKTVWHAWGTFGGNGMLPEFLIIVLLLIIPFYKHLKLIKRHKFLLFIFLLGIYMGYSKESILTLIVCLLIYYNLTSQNPKQAIIRTSVISAIFGIIGFILANTSYMDTVNDTIEGRLEIWQYPLVALSNNHWYIWFGSGLNSYWELIDPLLPPYLFQAAHFSMLAHNYYLLTVQEFGIVGAGLLFLFFIYTAKKFWENTKKYKGYYRGLNIAGIMFISTIFTTSFFGQLYYLTFAKVMIYIFLGLIIAKENCFNRINNKVMDNV